MNTNHLVSSQSFQSFGPLSNLTEISQISANRDGSHGSCSEKSTEPLNRCQKDTEVYGVFFDDTGLLPFLIQF